MRRKYEEHRFGAPQLQRLGQVNGIVAEYQAAGFSLTLRQLYYQFVARGLIPNRDREYKNLGTLVNNGRMAGLIDWNAIEDRTRYVRAPHPGWVSPESLVRSSARGYRRDRSKGQGTYAEVWIEKDALVGVIEGPCNRWDVPFFSCRGYVSASEMKVAADRFIRRLADGRNAVLFHLGDHDPSGIDMSRDIEDRLSLFIGMDLQYDEGWEHARVLDLLRSGGFRVERLALNMDQVDELNPPPNPAKVTDSRAAGYISEFGYESWELDALDPQALSDLVEGAVVGVIDQEARGEVLALEEEHRSTLTRIADRYSDVVEFVS